MDLTTLQTPLPDGGRGLKGTEIEMLMKVREDLDQVLKKLFPSTTTGGLDEFQTMLLRRQQIQERTVHEFDPIFVSLIHNRDYLGLFSLRRRVFESIFQQFKCWSKDDMLALILANECAGAVERYRGLPNSDPSKIIIPGSANIGL